MADTVIHGVRGAALDAGWVWQTGNWQMVVQVAPGQADLFCDVTIGQGPDVMVAPAGSQSWTMKAPGDVFHVDSAHPVDCRAVGPGASFRTTWGPAWLLEANRAYEGRRGTATRD